MRRTDRGMDEKTFYSIIKTIVPYPVSYTHLTLPTKA